MADARDPTDPLDPKGLIREAYAMELDPGEARSIFLDWALGQADAAADLPALLARHGGVAHPMTDVLREGLGIAAPPRRRGGRRGRVG